MTALIQKGPGLVAVVRGTEDRQQLARREVLVAVLHALVRPDDELQRVPPVELLKELELLHRL